MSSTTNIRSKCDTWIQGSHAHPPEPEPEPKVWRFAGSCRSFEILSQKRKSGKGWWNQDTGQDLFSYCIDCPASKETLCYDIWRGKLTQAPGAKQGLKREGWEERTLFSLIQFQPRLALIQGVQLQLPFFNNLHLSSKMLFMASKCGKMTVTLGHFYLWSFWGNQPHQKTSRISQVTDKL